MSGNFEDIVAGFDPSDEAKADIMKAHEHDVIHDLVHAMHEDLGRRFGYLTGLKEQGYPYHTLRGHMEQAVTDTQGLYRGAPQDYSELFESRESGDKMGHQLHCKRCNRTLEHPWNL